MELTKASALTDVKGFFSEARPRKLRSMREFAEAEIVLPAEHMAFAKHLTAEKKTEEFIAGKGVVAKWERIRKNNHWFDALSYACVAAFYCGVRLVQEVVKEAPKPKPEPKPQGRPRIDVQRWRDNNAWWMRERR